MPFHRYGALRTIRENDASRNARRILSQTGGDAAVINHRNYERSLQNEIKRNQMLDIHEGRLNFMAEHLAKVEPKLFTPAHHA